MLFANMNPSYALLWTALPVFIMVLYRLGFDAIVNATIERQPYIDLNRPANGKKRATARQTIMLDYRVYPMFYNWIIAFKMVRDTSFRLVLMYHRGIF
jgi:Protein of unknown function (DUF3433)